MNLILNRILRTACIFLTASLIGGCPIPFDNAFYEFNLRLKINDEPYLFTYNWHCYEAVGLDIETGKGIVKGWEVASPHQTVLSKLNDGSILIFEPPNRCDFAGHERYPYKLPPLLIVDSASNPTLIEEFTKLRTSGIKHKIEYLSESVENIEHSKVDYKPTAEATTIRHQLQNNSIGFQSVTATIYPESTWEKSRALQEYFRNAQGLIIASKAEDHHHSGYGLDKYIFLMHGGILTRTLLRENRLSRLNRKPCLSSRMEMNGISEKALTAPRQHFYLRTHRHARITIGIPTPLLYVTQENP